MANPQPNAERRQREDAFAVRYVFNGSDHLLSMRLNMATNWVTLDTMSDFLSNNAGADMSKFAVRQQLKQTVTDLLHNSVNRGSRFFGPTLRFPEDAMLVTLSLNGHVGQSLEKIRQSCDVVSVDKVGRTPTAGASETNQQIADATNAINKQLSEIASTMYKPGTVWTRDAFETANNLTWQP